MKKYIILILLLTNILLFAGLEHTTYSLSSEIKDTLYENIYISIPINSLIFKKQNSLYNCNLSIEISFLNKKHKIQTMEYIDTSFSFNNYSTTVSDSIIPLQFSLPIEYNYKYVNIKITDKNSNNEINHLTELLIPKRKKGESYIISINVPDNNYHFIRSDSMYFIVNYKLIDTLSNYYIKGSILKNNKSIYSKKFPIKNFCCDTILLSKELTSGKYIIKAELKKKNKTLSSLFTEFFIDFSFTYSDKEYMDLINALSYFGKNKDIKNLKSIENTKREKAWYDFWQENDSIIGITYDEFLRRYNYVNRYFSVYNKKGYQTDFGRVYLLFGKPDEIEKHPFEIESKPYEIWYYYTLGYEFIFVDEHNYGEYILQNYYEQVR